MGDFPGKVIPSQLNSDIFNSLRDRPMTWNLWNVVRHYVYIKYFKNRHKALGNDEAAWAELEKYVKKIVKGIYRTFQDKKGNTFGVIDNTSSNDGHPCLVKWTNSFVEISSIMERNAREHMASFVMFTGDIPKPSSEEL